ncbi:SRPBCC family protein [Isoptericola variabilis]|uniref:Polyketide cyclase/dehydrase n=1 Tax=Isoptericola variabilis (strain 225) TaxID=743718 RepID=F6FTB0_ISOV2|nr:SRPBCC family protein [Isoptericola variabilis]AEG45274.1 Polyketide cyclase/dehydrase [Isoptericola variabilis 225]TWH34774.1 polyketide cyclase/dehydrase/lipid transport protein [Isoptericola variabilis J7]
MRVESARLVPVEASVAYAWVADPRTHPRWIPLTRFDGGMRSGPEVGDEFTMVSGPRVRRGARGLADRMVVEELTRPSTAAGRVGRTRLRKLGPVLLGDAGFDVVPVDAGRCRVVWWEEAYLAGPVPRAVTDPAVGLFLRALMGVSLARLNRRLARGAR